MLLVSVEVAPTGSNCLKRKSTPAARDMTASAVAALSVYPERQTGAAPENRVVGEFASAKIDGGSTKKGDPRPGRLIWRDIGKTV